MQISKVISFVKTKYIRFFELDALPRYTSSILGTFTFIYFLAKLDRNTFIQLQVMIAIGGVLIWLTDVGLVNRSILYYLDQKPGRSKYLMTLRFSIFIVSVVFIAIWDQLVRDQFSYILFLGVACDLFGDSLAISRTAFSNSSFPNIWLFLKKLMIFCIISSLVELGIKVDATKLGIALLLSSLLTFVADFLFWRQHKMEVFHNEYRLLLLNWIQIGGSTVSGLDTILVAKTAPELVAIIAFAKKCSNLLGVNSGRMIRNTLLISSNNLKTFVINNLKFVAFFQVLIIAFTYVLNESLFKLKLDSYGSAVFISIILLFSVGYNTSLLNLRIQKENSYKDLTIINWSTSLAFLALIYVGIASGEIYIFYVIGVLVNQVTELLLQLRVMKRFLD